MRVPSANPSGDQLIRDYLTRVTHAGLRLPKGQRMAFIGRTKARIEREVGPDGLADPGKVLEVLASLGEPEDLVRAERAKIDAAWARRRAGSREAGEAAAAAITTPRQHRSIASRWKPATDTQPLPHLARSPQSSDPPTDPGGTPPVPAAPTDAGLTLAATARLARRHVLETIALVLLAVGGVLFPIVPPVWVAGSLLALGSRAWDLRDKVVGLFGPGFITVVVAAMIAVVNRVPGNFMVIYAHAVADGAGFLLRFGCVVCAAYLGWRVHRGPREKVPPWRREVTPRRSPWFRSR